MMVIEDNIDVKNTAFETAEHNAGDLV